MNQQYEGTTLCSRHAKQVAREQRLPEGDCFPSSSWRSGSGREVVCDAVGAPERIDAYLAEQARRRKVNNR